MPNSVRPLHIQAMIVASATGLSQLTMAGMFVIAARQAGPGEFGAIASAIAVATAAAGLVDFGSNGLWVRELANGRVLHRDVTRRYWWKTSCAVAAGACAVVAGALPSGSGTWIVSAGIAVCMIWSQGTAVFLVANHMSERVAYALVAERAMGFVILGSLLLAHVHVAWALPIALVVGSLIGTCSMWALTPRASRPRPVGVGRPTNPWRGVSGFAGASIANGLAVLDTAVIQTTAGAATAGVYAAVNRWTQPMGLLANAVSASSAPFLSSAKSASDALRALRSSAWMLVAACLLAAVVAVGAPWIVPLVLGDAYVDSVATLQFLAVGSAVSVWNQPVAALLQARDRDKAVAVVRVLATLAFLVAIGIVAPASGARGVAAAYVGLQLAIAIAFGVVAARAFRARRVAARPTR